MRRWLIWAGIAIILGGAISLGMTLTVEGDLNPDEDLTPYGIGWIIAGSVLIGAGFILKPKNR
ncbi:MAG TPA: hypothetical protein VFG25_03935 [Nitrosopumilaceae archaeon]|nr:hypothetical protein [Nitrosopumilaceae archaeon]